MAHPQDQGGQVYQQAYQYDDAGNYDSSQLVDQGIYGNADPNANAMLGQEEQYPEEIQYFDGVPYTYVAAYVDEFGVQYPPYWVDEQGNAFEVDMGGEEEYQEEEFGGNYYGADSEMEASDGSYMDSEHTHSYGSSGLDATTGLPTSNSEPELGSFGGGDLLVEGGYQETEFDEEPAFAAPVPQASPVQTALSSRQRIVKSIVESERVYVEDLERIVQWYKKPLEEQGFLALNEIELVFSNVEDIFKAHSKLITELEKSTQAGINDWEVEMGPFFQNVIPDLTLYGTYSDGHDASIESVTNFRAKKPQFEKHVLEVSRLPECAGRSLKAFLVKPIQRICKYPVFIKSLLANTPDNHHDRLAIVQALSAFENIVVRVNSSKDQSANFGNLARFDDLISGYPVNIVQPGRRFLNEVKVLRAVAKKNSIQYVRRSDGTPSVLVLFSDKLLLCIPSKGYKKREKHSLNFKREILLQHLVVIDSEFKSSDHDISILLETSDEKRKTSILYFESPEMKKEWYKLLRTSCGKAKLAAANNRRANPNGAPSPVQKVKKADSLHKKSLKILRRKSTAMLSAKDITGRLRSGSKAGKGQKGKPGKGASMPTPARGRGGGTGGGRGGGQAGSGTGRTQTNPSTAPQTPPPADAPPPQIAPPVLVQDAETADAFFSAVDEGGETPRAQEGEVDNESFTMTNEGGLDDTTFDESFHADANLASEFDGEDFIETPIEQEEPPMDEPQHINAPPPSDRAPPPAVVSPARAGRPLPGPPSDIPPPASTPETSDNQPSANAQQLEQQLASLKVELDQSQKLYQAELEAKEKHAQEVEDFQAEIAALKAKVEASKEPSAVVSASLKVLQAENKVLKLQKANAEREKQKAVAEKEAEVKESMEKMTTGGESAWLGEKLDLQKQNTLLVQSKQGAVKEKESALAAKEEAEKKAAAALSENDMLVKERDVLNTEKVILAKEKEVAIKQKAAAEKARDDIKAEKEVLEKRNAAGSAASASHAQELASLRKEKDLVAREKGILEKEKETALKEAGLVIKERDSLKKDKSSLKKERDAAKKERDSFKKEVSSLKKEIKSLKDDLKTSKSEVKALQAAEKSLTDAINSLQKEASDASSALEAAKHASAQEGDAVAELKAKLEAAQGELSAAQAQATSANAATSQAQAEAAQAKTEAAEANGKVAQAQSEAAQAKKEADDAIAASAATAAAPAPAPAPAAAPAPGGADPAVEAENTKLKAQVTRLEKQNGALKQQVLKMQSFMQRKR
eukprot:TRINITY_DN5350_c0_g1_i1.p1 TRINITY_DN5350_c0_g1~~TRINITY_DN5350_c0_g1_i1.p1  ORF type:complete len:1286 (-),score=427.02 TRINITY_DN5350_c0_g1_i1:177-3959(-)